MRFPFHKYLGPGNNLNIGEPIDEDDRIALVHDIHYHLAKSNKDIRKSDEESIIEFYNNFLRTGNWYSLIDGTGLSIKYIVESIVNVQYPKLMSSTSTTRKPNKITHRGHSLYAARQKELSNLYKAHKRSGESYGQFCQRIKEDPNIDTGSIENTIDAPIAGSAFPDRHGSRALDNIEDRNIANNEFNFDHIFNMDNSAMDVQNDMGDSLSTPQGNRAGSDSTRSAVTFTKCYTFYSYGYCINKFDSPDKATHLTFSNTNYFSTPLSYLPVDQICAYISKCEMDAIRGCVAYALDCSASVKILGVRSAFDTGTTLSGGANSEHVAIACTGIGINNVIPSNIVSYTTDASAPMTPTGSKAFNADDLITRLYEDDAAAVLGVPRNNPYFLSIALNKDASGITPPNTTNYVPHNNGMPLLNKYIDRFHVMSHVGEKVLEYNYKFNFAPLTYPPCVDLCNGNRVDTIDNDIPNVSSRNVQQSKDGLVQLAKTANAFNTTWSTGITRGYNQQIEQYYLLKASGNSNIIHEQPKAYIGLFAIPKLNPALQSTDFQNSCIYYDVQFVLNVSMDYNSIYASGPIHTTPDKLIAIPTKGNKNRGGQTLCGYFDEGTLYIYTPCPR
ncbi:hypothetical protein FQA39_LY17849 [Lamprigera yunnana]|nr:hypothetical protein FQA39_LY17849 [Lamprigera yunnana]